MRGASNTPVQSDLRSRGLALAACGAAAVFNVQPLRADPPIPADRQPPGPAERAGAAIDAAAARAASWYHGASAAARARAGTVGDTADRWLGTTERTLWGTPRRCRPSEVSIAVAPPAGPRNPESPGGDMPIVWRRLSAGNAPGSAGAPGLPPLPPRLVVLVHGLDEPGGMWNDLAPALVASGFSVVKFDYPNDQHIADSADLLGSALRGLKARGVFRVDIVAHSMGGLVARDLLTRPVHYHGDGSGTPDLPRLQRLIVVSAPNLGSMLAPLEPVSEAREHVIRHLDGLDQPGDGWFHSYADGNGEAAEDLAPGSAFLTDLAGRPSPTGVAVTNIIASVVPPDSQERALRAIDHASEWVGGSCAQTVRKAVRSGACAATGCVGDGLVTGPSASWPEVADTVRIAGDHRGIVQRWRWLDSVDPDCRWHSKVPAAIPVILDRLVRE